MAHRLLVRRAVEEKVTERAIDAETPLLTGILGTRELKDGSETLL
jgi:hypothetical protein